MKHRIRFLILAVTLCANFIFWNTSPGKADIGPDPWPPGSNISPSTSTQVRMVEEYVQMDLCDAREVDPLSLQFPQSAFVARVQADF